MPPWRAVCCSPFTVSHNSRRKLYALVYTDALGRERRNWYGSRKEAELVGVVIKCKFRIEEYTL
jgi:hypothetical protein